MHRKPRFSIWELLALVFVACFAISSLCAGGVIADLFVTSVVGLTMASLILSVVSTGQVCSRARGFVVPILGYVMLIGLVGRQEVTANGIFPSTKCIRAIYKSLGGFDALPGGGFLYGGMMGGGMMGGGMMGDGMMGGSGYGVYSGLANTAATKPNRLADQQTFFIVGHTLLCLTLGYIGANYASIVTSCVLTKDVEEP